MVTTYSYHHKLLGLANRKIIWLFVGFTNLQSSYPALVIVLRIVNSQNGSSSLKTRVWKPSSYYCCQWR
uniref:UORF n=1 Tax=Enterovirus J TaxID=1330521 RepID=A0A649ZUZ8_9ENTO|nr:uORF [Enterovirus J]